MARKRIIDPEFWSDEEVGLWSFQARLFYIGVWNFADDEGRFKAHTRLLKSQIFPYDEKVDIEKIKIELGNKIQWYEIDGLQYGFVRNFLKHQRIDKAQQSKLPTPPPFNDNSSNVRRTVDEQSTNVRRIVPPNISKDNISKEKRREEYICPPNENLSDESAGQIEKIEIQNEKRPQCPHKEIIALYHKSLPELPELKVWNNNREALLRQRWNEAKERQTIDWWKEYFHTVKESDFLCGKIANKDGRPFLADFEWLIKPSNMPKVLEGRYKNNGVKQRKSPIDELLEEYELKEKQKKEVSQCQA